LPVWVTFAIKTAGILIHPITLLLQCSVDAVLKVKKGLGI
jgi:hypothetical protein